MMAYIGTEGFLVNTELREPFFRFKINIDNKSSGLQEDNTKKNQDICANPFSV